MNYKFLAKKEIEKFFEETDLTVGEILKVILSERLTGITIENRSVLMKITDKEWYEIIEQAFEYEKE